MTAIESILRFKIDNKVFGIDSERVSQILRVPSITSVPLTEDAFRGVSVVGGKIVSVIDLGILFSGVETDKKGDSARIITFSYEGANYAFLVEETLGITFVNEENYEQSSDPESKIMGFYKENGNVYQIIAIDKVLKGISLLGFSSNQLEISNNEISPQQTKESEEIVKYLFLKVGSESFAVDIDTVKELVFVPGVITPLPEAEDFVLGMITLRDEIVNTLDLSYLLGFGRTKVDDRSRLVIVQYDNKSIALLVGSIEEVKDISTDSIETVPEAFKDKKIEAVYKDEEGNIASILSSSFLKELIHSYYLEEEDAAYSSSITKEEISMTEVVVFGIGSEEFAMNIDNVQEIIRYSEVTPMPDAPEFVEGVINLRGVVIPIVSLQERLGFEKKITGRTKILICNIKNSKIGFLVDDVSEILSVEDKYITSSKSENTLFEDVITLENGERVILKLRTEKLFKEDDLEELKMINKGEK